MASIYETENFTLESREQPFITRTEGGHLRILCKDKVKDRTELSPKKAIELMRLTMIAGKALEVAMNNRGINVVKVNYEDLGNWAYKKNEEPNLHVHILGRAKDAKYQKFPEAPHLPDRNSGFYDDFVPLDEDDIEEIKKQMNLLIKQDRYKESDWKLI